MGMPLGDLSGRSLWDFQAIVTAWNTAHDPDAERDITDAEFDELGQWLETMQVAVQA